MSGRLPRFLVTTADGKAAVFAARTGRRLAVIARPARIYAYQGVAAAADDRTFFLAGADPSAGSWKIEFFRVHLDRHGRPTRPRLLRGQPLIVPTPVISGGWMNFDIAVSPDGSKLAFASGTPFPAGPGTPYGPPQPVAGASERVIVQDVATGSRRTWSLWRSAHAILTQFSWGASGRLGYDIAASHAAVSRARLVHKKSGQKVAAFMVLDTARAGSSLVRNAAVVSYSVLRGRTPQEAQGVITPSGRAAIVHLTGAVGGRIVRVALSTPTNLRLVTQRPALGDPMTVDAGGAHLLFARLVKHSRLSNPQAPYTQARLAYLNLLTRAFTPLHIPVVASINGAFDIAW